LGQDARLKSIARFDHCYGCGVCVAACPFNAISMELTPQGFFSPVVNLNCTGCSQCLNVCAFNAKETITFASPIKAYAGWSKNPVVRDTSTSGGVIYELCSAFISRGFKICAVRYNYKKKRTEHFVFSSLKELTEATGSKYIQSYSVDALSSLDLKSEQYVIIGTPCMISSVKRMVKQRHAEGRVVLIDFFCHGVPSYLLWYKYESHVSRQVGHIQSISWRNKDNGWQDSTAVKASGTAGRYLSFHSKGDLFFDFFLGDRCLNRCCYDDCVYKGTHSDADIRVGDLWSPKSEYVNNRLGINAIFAFTQTGLDALNSCSGIDLNEELQDDVMGNQMRKNPKRSASYNYVAKSLHSTTPLSVIGQKATRIEDYHRLLQVGYYRYLFNRILGKV